MIKQLLSLVEEEVLVKWALQYTNGDCLYASTTLINSHQLEALTVSGLSSGRTLCPSNRKRTVDSCFPCLSQKAFINFSNFVDLLILKKTSLSFVCDFDIQMFSGWGRRVLTTVGRVFIF